jgi:carboxymethylenebutenolidase
MTMTDIPTLDGGAAFPAYVARPAGTPRAAIIVIQEIFGVNAGIRGKADLLAADGYLAVAPDLFWRINDATNLDPDVPEQLQVAFGLFGEFDQQAGIVDLEATTRWARAEMVGGKVGCVGYCLGGRLATLCAMRTDVDASVGYYGVGIEGLLGEAHAIAHPLMLHIPTADHFVGPDAQAAMHAGLDDHPKVTLYDYAGLDHGFAAQTGSRRDEAGAQLADSRTSAFFAEHLG